MNNFTEEFLAFCRSKPAKEWYSPYQGDHCALAQFGFRGVYRSNAEERGIPSQVFSAAIAGDNTFGALTARLEALAEQVPA